MKRTFLFATIGVVSSVAFPLAGACNNTADLAIYKSQASTFKDVVQKCATSTMGNADKTAACLVKATGISAPCSMCWGDDSHCVATKCLSKCIANPDSAACLQCNSDYCLPALVTCGGVPAKDLPHTDLAAIESMVSFDVNDVPDLGFFQIDGYSRVDITATAKSLLSKLNSTAGTFATNATLGVSERSSFHMFATNRTESCHYHPGDTTSTVLFGHGQFFSTSPVVQQPTGSVYFIPKGSPHAFGHVGPPTVVMVAWSPPFHEGYTIPTTGCKTPSPP